MKNSTEARAITDSAVLIALTFVIMLVGNFLGFTLLMTAIAFIPLALIYIKHDLKWWACGSIVSTALFSLFTGIINGIVSAIPVVILSFAYGYSIKKNRSGGNTLCMLMIGSLISLIISICIYIYMILGISITTFIQKYIIDLYKPMMAESAKLLGGKAEYINQINQLNSFLTIKNILIIMPTILIIYAFIMALISIVIANNTLKRLNFKVNQVESFSKWYIHPIVALILVIGSIFGVILAQNGLNIGNSIIFSSMMLLFVIYSIEGLSLIYFLIEKNTSFGNSKSIPVILVIFMIFSGSIGVLFMGILGIVDLLMDTRGINKNSLMKMIKQKFE